MKKCNICKIEKSLDNFNKNKSKKDGFNTLCRKCSQKHSKKYYQLNKEHHQNVIKQNRSKRKDDCLKLLHEFKANGCTFCNEKEMCCIDCHHVNSEDKLYSISQMVYENPSINKFVKELSKCIPVCANCHRKLHDKEKKINY